MKCIHLGEHVGQTYTECCGGKKNYRDVYACNSPQQSADYCALHGGSKSLGSLQLTGSEVPEVKTIAVCSSCPFREQPVSPCQINMPTVQQMSAEVGKSRVRAAWEKIRQMRSPQPGINQVIVLDCDRHGYGDAVLAAWIAEGTKMSSPKLLLRATGVKKGFLEMIGQSVVNLQPTGTYGGEYLDTSRNVGSPPFVKARALKLGIKAEPRKPPLIISNGDLEWAESRKADILIFPHCKEGSRSWADENWRSCYEELSKEHSVRVLSSSRVDWCGEYEPTTWGQVAALMTLAKCVAGNDSGPMHLASVVGVKGVVVLGRTSSVVFAHAPNITCLEAEKREVPCAGCWGGWMYDRNVCERGCVAMMHISHDKLISEVIKCL